MRAGYGALALRALERGGAMTVSRRTIAVLEKDLRLAERDRSLARKLGHKPASVLDRDDAHFRARAAAFREALSVLRPLARRDRSATTCST
jgi:hypothetical protein